MVETKKRAENWYDSTVDFLELAVHGREKFIGGDIQAKQEVLSNLGQNPVLLDGKLQITPFPFLEHIAEAYPELEAEYLNLPTLPQQRQKEAFERLRLSWLGKRGNVQTILEDYRGEDIEAEMQGIQQLLEGTNGEESSY